MPNRASLTTESLKWGIPQHVPVDRYRIEKTETNFQVTAYNDRIAIQTIVAATSDSGFFVDIDARESDVANFLANMPSISMEMVSGRGLLTFETRWGIYGFPCYSEIEGCPALPPWDCPDAVEIDCALLNRAIGEVSSAALQGSSDSLGHVCFRCGNGALELIATDGLRLAWFRDSRSPDGPEIREMIPLESLRMLGEILSLSDARSGRVARNSSHLVFSFGGRRIAIRRNPELAFFDILQDPEAPTTMQCMVAREPLIKVLDRFLTVRREGKAPAKLGFRWMDGWQCFLTVNSSPGDPGCLFQESIGAVSLEGPVFSILVDPVLLRSALRSMNGLTTVIEGTDADSILILRGGGDCPERRSRQLVRPMKEVTVPVLQQELAAIEARAAIEDAALPKLSPRESERLQEIVRDDPSGLSPKEFERLWRIIRDDHWVVSAGQVASIVGISPERAAQSLRDLAAIRYCKPRVAIYHGCSEATMMLAPEGGLEYPFRCSLCDEEIESEAELSFVEVFVR